MAELTAAPVHTGWRLAREQMRAIASLRWRILLNGFRRRGGKAELAGRLLLALLLLGLSLLPILLAAVAAFYLTQQGQLAHLAWILWVAFGLTQLLNINLGQPDTTFNPVDLVRFPMPLRRFILVRLGFGVLSPGNVVVSLVSAAVVVGITAAEPGLFFPALATLAIFAAANVLFTRMVFAWVDRWLSTRRARELFTAVLFLGSIAIQYLNVRFNPGFQPGAGRHAIHQGAPAFGPILRFEQAVRWTPPELSGAAMAAAGAHRPWAFWAENAASAAFGLSFLAIYSFRMRAEFRGEAFSDAATLPRRLNSPEGAGVLPAAVYPQASGAVRSRLRIPPSIGPLLTKELLVLRRNVGLFYGLVTPAIMVFLFAGRLSTHGGSRWVLFGAVAYALLGIAPLSYNAFGMEGTGAQLYFYAPLPLREVFVAKNAFALLLAGTEILVVVGITTEIAGKPALLDLLVVLLWAVGALLLNTTVGNLRSVAAPKKVNPGRSLGKAQSAVSGFLAVGLLLGCAALGFAAETISTLFHREWILVLFAAAFAGAGMVAYSLGLRGMERYALAHRDVLFEELSRKS